MTEDESGNTIAQSAIEDYVSYWENINLRSIRLIEKIASPDFTFTDPFHDLRGIEAFENMMKESLGKLENPKFKVIDYAKGREANTVYLKWIFIFQIGRKKEMSITGMSEVIFNASGKVTSHIDYWDSHSQLFCRLPFIGAFFRFIQRRAGGG